MADSPKNFKLNVNDLDSRSVSENDQNQANLLPIDGDEDNEPSEEPLNQDLV